MNKTGGNLYKYCWNFADFTQEYAASKLYIEVRILSDYENGKKHVPNNIVAMMAKLYNIPSLPYYHVKYYTELGEFFPEYIEPNGLGDMAFQGVVSRDDLIDTIDKFTGIIKICKNEEIPPDKLDEYMDCMNCFKVVGGRVLSIEAYGRQKICNSKNEEKEESA